MAIFYVDGNAGSDGNPGDSAAPWKTLTKAASAAAAWDTVYVRSGVYRENLNITKPGMKFIVEAGHEATIDGGYGPHLFGDPAYTTYTGAPVKPNNLPWPSAANIAKGGWAISNPNDEWAQLVRFGADGIEVSGFTIRNSCARGVEIYLVKNCLLEDCVIDFTFTNSIAIDSCENITVRNCRATRGGLKYFEINRPGGANGINVPSCIMNRNSKGTRFSGLKFAYHYGEGLTAGGPFSMNTIVEDCAGHDCLHAVYYIDGGYANITYDRCVGYCSDNMGGPGLGLLPHDPLPQSEILIIADEEHRQNYPDPSATIVNCLFVGGWETALWIANGNNSYPAKWDRAAPQNKWRVVGNTLVGSKFTKDTLRLGQDGAFPHQNGLVENNLVWTHPENAGPAVTEQQNWATTTFRNNLYNKAVPAQIIGAGDVLVSAGAAVMVNPGAAILANYQFDQADIPDTEDTTFDKKNYQLVAGSPAIGAGNGSMAPVWGMTPPSKATDMLGAARAEKPDIGAMQYAPDSEPEPVFEARFAADPEGAALVAGAVVQFTNQSVIENTTLTGYAWLVERDGATVAEAATEHYSHTFETAGEYTVTLTLATAAGSDSATAIYTVTPQPAVTAAFAYTAPGGAIPAGTSVTFVNESTAEGTTIASVEWVVWSPAGEAQEFTTTDLTCTFAEPGEWVVSLTVHTAAGLTATEEVELMVIADEPEPELPWWQDLTDEEWREFLSAALAKLAALLAE